MSQSIERMACSACGIGKRMSREDHPEKCPESPPGERAEWEEFRL